MQTPNHNHLGEKFQRLLTGEGLQAVYQPIISLESGRVLGWESLMRGPSDSYFSNPDAILEFAERGGLLFPLERACRQKAISGIGEIAADQILFLNIHPLTISDPAFARGETRRMLEHVGLSPQNVVFEITEKYDLKDYSVTKKVVSHYRQQGYRIALDDMGAGFSGLQSVAEIRPDFMKIDMSLIRDIDRDSARQSVIETIVDLAERMSCRCIAEGIETEAELTALLAMGVHYGQGYLFSYPSSPKPLSAVAAAAAHIKRWQKSKSSRRLRSSQKKSVSDIMSTAITVGEEHIVAEAKEILDRGLSSDNSSIVIIREGRPVGLVMKHRLYHMLSSRYGVSLYMFKAINTVMDRSPLLINSAASIEEAVEAALGRGQEKSFDDVIVVTEEGLVVGVVAVKKMVDTLTEAQVKEARVANPLSGLPGNVAIEEELKKRKESRQSCTVIYSDLDRFKAYNDTYGFRNGDSMLMLLARIISHSVRRHGSANDFVGHIGGDDMVVITHPEFVEKICQSIVRLFDRQVQSCFSPQDRDNGGYYGLDREGTKQWIPFVTVSLGIIDCQDERDYRMLGEKAAAVKKYAKSFTGSVYVRDRRA
ncbi:EAL and GGDEF domain-containing protein [Thermodesulfovibrionales bacterium]|nr:EAL and GGDEF domain-containing protein [Thermodesulfovibrionales bacterium]